MSDPVHPATSRDVCRFFLQGESCDMIELEVRRYPKDQETSVAKKNQSIPRAESPKLAAGYPPQDLENASSFPP